MKYNSDDLEVKITSRGGSGKSAVWHWNVWVKGPGGARLANGVETGTWSKAETAAEIAKAKFIA
ncbi:hypothetical protein [Aestuariivirga litoralis]|uniref:hypothetical protein n=1 Tax=Aestuariivirga litoralis TaxID=2650924 RepID=UPI0018C79665|nr:hypothetical protein [Aestuariivirga litoralis]MBG1231692.1 hypothetical protein [Aestuariivirga litoralis]